MRRVVALTRSADGLAFHLLAPFLATEEQLLRAELDGLGEVSLLGELL
ncbi:MAG: hypothetical protein AB1938_21350 [Myxococcota bacterium]